jgi:general secretion pathway protein D
MNDRVPARIYIGDKVPVTISTTQQSYGGTTGTSIPSYTTTQVQFFDIGITMEITPTIHSDNEVTLDMKVNISSVGKINVQSNIPEIGTRETKTILRLKNGETNILSGLTKEEERVSKTHLPILSDIPLLGLVFDVIFGSTTTQKISSEIIMSVTPTIISSSR